MQARLIALTQPVVPELQTCGQMLAYIARVSNPSNQLNHLTGPALLRYMTEHKHWSPFEMANAVIEITTTRDIGRQVLRHWSIRFQEFSQRYAEVIEPLVIREARLQDTKNRQKSIELDESTAWLQDAWARRQQYVADVANEEYAWALSQGIAKECARVVLPEGMTPSTMYANGNMRSWLHYILLRGDEKEGTQKEHREIALACGNILARAIPELKEFLCEK